MKKQNRGSAMILVMCVMAVTAALSLALLLSVSVMMGQAVRSGQKEQCRINAVSVSDVLIGEITSFQYENTMEQNSHIRPDENLKDRLQMIVDPEQMAGSWDEYPASFTYQMADGVLPGSTEVRMYWIDENDRILYLEVTGTVGRDSCTIISRFAPQIDPGEVSGADGMRQWKKWSWVYRGHEWERSR